MKCYILLVTVTAVALQLCEPVAVNWTITEVDGVPELTCKSQNIFDENNKDMETKTLILSDPSSGIYKCSGIGIYVNYSVCLNCVPMDFGGIAGIVIASLTFTILIAAAVYSVSAQDKTWSHQASDRHPLMRNDINEAVYSHLNNDNRAMYSELGRRARH
ncbi:T-cell surface glycoprotein CD3 delta chain-like isoform X2 [Rhincodon typus]|uniref:T-cell surface glycoprotein CD3 delta chain-like isoform X2 n=1 Tax=Rhincodon typus TaxID=259920 RepID=UPI00202EF3CA|nr:T-cell surface glycoprotein CD3 delta chain-like isoform X2 [Rhincodon typus]